MSGQVTITQLPTAGSITGTELVPVVQNGVTVQTTTGAISGAGALNYPFLTVGSTSGLSQARYITVGSGLTTTDSGAGSTLNISMTGAANSLNSVGNGLIVKTGTNSVTNVSLTVGGGMTISNADGTSGNPLIGLNTNLQALSSISGTGLINYNGTTFGSFTLQGTTNQISIANANASSGSPTFSIASNPTLPGNSYVQLPSGTTAQRGSPSYGAIRNNSDTGLLEAYTASTGWSAIGLVSAGVSSFSAGTTGFTPSTPTVGGVVLGGTLNPSNGGTGLSTLATGAIVYGAVTSAYSTLSIGTAGQVLTVNSGATAPQWTSLSTFGVTTFSGGTTGLTPSSATSGAITLAGTLAIANGGTGQTTANSGFNALSPMTTQGDIIYGGTSGVGTRLAIGTSGQVLTSSGTAPQYVAQSTLSVGSATNATNTTNTGITAVTTGATNYLTFVTATSGNLPQLVNSSITCNAANGTLTGGISGGGF